ncbi:MAG: hypothetical protein IJU41_05125, partial [Clostridia bacterium]|nr:hypothetical protein [Clostridia bacterium]
VDTLDGVAYVVKGASSLVLNFTDGTSASFSNVVGDTDGDGEVTLFDAVNLLHAFLNGQSVRNGDLNGDGRIGIADVIRLLKQLAA